MSLLKIVCTNFQKGEGKTKSGSTLPPANQPTNKTHECSYYFFLDPWRSDSAGSATAGLLCFLAAAVVVLVVVVLDAPLSDENLEQKKKNRAYL